MRSRWCPKIWARWTARSEMILAHLKAREVYIAPRKNNFEMFRRLTERKRLPYSRPLSFLESEDRCISRMSKPKVLKTGPDSSLKKGKRSGADGGRSTPGVRRRFAEWFRHGDRGKNQGTRPPGAGAGPPDLQRHQRGAAGKHESTPEELDEIYTKLRSLEIEIVDQAEVDRVKTTRSRGERTRRGWTSWTTRCGCI